MAHDASQVTLIHNVHFQLQRSDAQVRSDVAVPYRLGALIRSLERFIKVQEGPGGLAGSRVPEQKRTKRGVYLVQQRCDDLYILGAAAQFCLELSEGALSELDLPELVCHRSTVENSP